MNTQQSTFRPGAIGSDDFKELIESGDYVDKSLFIKDIIHDKHKVLLITRPRRWGKSSNMSLLKTFLEIEVDKEGNILPEDQKVNPVYFTGGMIGFRKKTISHEGLKISKEGEVMEELGQYPVIMMGFKDLGGSSYAELVEDLKIKLIEVFDNHQYLAVSDKLKPSEKERINKYLVGEVSVARIKNAIKFLMECLYKHFNQKVWVLIPRLSSLFA